MNRLICACLTAMAINASPQLQAQSLQAKLEVNLGPIAFDLYNGTSQNNSGLIASGPNIPACGWGAGSNYRACMQSVLSSYSQQGVVGVRFQFAINGEVSSTPFLNQSGALSANWLANFSLFLQDLRAANLRYVSMSPAWVPWATGNMTIYACISGAVASYSYDFSCTSSNANAVLYPWLPWALSYSAAGGPGGPFDAAALFDYDYVPQLGPATPSHQPFQWTSSPASGWSASNACSLSSGPPLFNLFDCIFKAAGNAQLSIRELDLIPELAIHASSVYGRIVYDNVQLVHPLDIINQIMQADGFAPAATISTAAYQPLYDGACASSYQNYSNSGLVLDAFLLLSAQSGGQFGEVPGVFSGNYCDTISPTDTIPGEPVGSPLAVLDVHAYPADFVLDTGWGWIADSNTSGPQSYPDGAAVTNSPNGCAGSGCTLNVSRDIDPGNTSASSQTAASMIYGAVSNFAGFWSGIALNPNVPIIIGETDQYNPGGIGQGGNYFPAMTEGSGCTTYGIYGSILFDQYADPGTGVVHNLNFTCPPDWKWHRPTSSVSAGENTAGFSQTGLNRSSVVLRPWAPVSWGTVLTPAPLSGSTSLPYNVGGCALSVSGYSQPVGSSGGAITLSVVNSATPSCQWSIGPATPQQPLAGPLTWSSGTSGIVTSASINNGANCVYPSQGSSNCWGTGTGTSSVTFQIAPNQTQNPQSFALNVAGVNVPLTQGAPLAAPTLQSPGNGAANVPATGQTLTWNGSAGASQYLVYFGTTNPPSFVISTAGTSFATGPLAAGTTYYWNIVAEDQFLDKSAAPPVYSFTTQSTGGSSPVLQSPAIGATGVSTSPTLTWSATPGATSYSLYVGVSSSPPNIAATTGTSFTLAALSNNTTYYWLVMATTLNGNTSSTTGYFTTAPSTTSPGSLLSQFGVFRSSGGVGLFVLDVDESYSYDAPPDKVAYFGSPGDIPVAGNWTGMGVVSIGVFRCAAGACNWYIDLNNNGQWDGVAGGDAIWSFGVPGDLPVVGDWTGDGISKIGVMRCPPVSSSSSCLWILDAGNKHGYDPGTAVIGSYGLAGDLPVVNNWNGGTKDQIGVVRCSSGCTWFADSNGDFTWEPSDAQYSYGVLGDRPIVGNWFGSGSKRIGIWRGSTGQLILNLSGSNSWTPMDFVGSFGSPGDQPVMGKWTIP